MRTSSPSTRGTVGFKVLSLLLSTALLFSTSLVPARATNASQENGLETTRTAEISQDQSQSAPSHITYRAEHASLFVNGSRVSSDGWDAEQGQSASFSVLADDGYVVTTVEACSNDSSTANIALSDTGGGSFTIDASDLAQHSSIVITVKAEAIVVATEETAAPASNSGKSDPAQNTQLAASGTPVTGRSVSIFDATYHTVTFMVPGSSTPYYSEQVLAGTLVNVPTDPESPDGTPFHAWFSEDGATPFDYSKPITADTTLLAVFTADKHLVTYMDYDGTCLTILSVEDGAALPDETPNLPRGMELDFWSLEDPIGPFTGPIVSNVTVYPIALESPVAIFITDGPIVPSQIGIVRHDEVSEFTPTRPSNALMVRQGYTFSHWSLTKDGDIPYEFDTPLRGTTYIYAVWTAEKVGYILNVWNEKTGVVGEPGFDRGNYEVIQTKAIPATDPLAGYSGTSLNVTATGDDPADKITPSLINDRSNYETSPTTDNVLDYSEFYWCDADVEVLSNFGTTVIDVFAKRSVFPFAFDLKNARTPNQVLPCSFRLDGSETRYTAADFPETDGLYTLNLKLGQSVIGLWPRSVTPADTTSPQIFRIWDGYYGTSTEIVAQGSIQQAMTGNYKNIGRVQNRPSRILKGDYATSGTYETRYYYTEVLESSLTQAEKDAAIPSTDNRGQLVGADTITPTTTQLVKHTADNVTRYYRFNSRALDSTLQSGTTAQVISKTTGWPGTLIPGFLQITTSPVNLVPKYQLASTQAAFRLNGMDGIYVIYYMPRLSYTLDLITDNDATIDTAFLQGYTPTATGYSRTFLYEEKIVLPAAPPVKTDGASEFVGWYLDHQFEQPYFVDGQPTISSMPGSNLTLYAKYRGTNVHVRYYDGPTGDLVTEATYGRGDALSQDDLIGTLYEGIDFGEPVSGKGLFRGWFYDVSGSGNMADMSWGTILTENQYALYSDFDIDIYDIVFMVPDDQGDYTITHRETHTYSGIHNTLAWHGFTENQLNDVVKPGYAFVEWNTKPDGSGDTFYSATPITEDMTVYAQFELLTYGITYELNDSAEATATNPAVNPDSYTIHDTPISLADPVRDGFTFGGWFANSALTIPVGDPAITEGETGNKTFYAKWIAPSPTPDPSPQRPSSTSTSTPKTGDAVSPAPLATFALLGTSIAAVLLALDRRQKARR